MILWIQKRLSRDFALFLTFCVLFIALISEGHQYFKIKAKLKSDFSQKVTQILEFVGHSIAPAVWNLDTKQASEIANIAMNDENILCFAIISDSEDFLRICPKTSLGEAFRNGEISPEDSETLHRIIQYNQQKIADLRIIYSLGEFHKTLNDHLLFSIVKIVLLVGLIVAAIYFYVQRKIISPIQKIEHFANRITKGEYDHQIQIASPNEIGLLTQDLEKMRNAIRQSILELKRTNENLESIVEERTKELQQINGRLQTELESKVQLNRELEQSRRKAEEATQAKAKFLATMSHELRTPLNGILGFSELLLEDAKTQGLTLSMQEDLEKIHTSGKWLLSMINDILDFSKIEAGKMELYVETFHLRKAIEETVSILKPNFTSKKNQFHLDFSEESLTLHQDSKKIRQTVLNLLSNANKFTENGTITLRILQLHAGPIRFEIQDTGIGMTPEQQSKLFQSFQQADKSITSRFGGTGLGLAISKAFVEMMQGSIGVTSTPNQGSCFWFEIPQNHPTPQT